jgi:hypothetical protein
VPPGSYGQQFVGYVVFALGLVLIATGHGWAINWAYVRLAGHHRHHQRRAYALEKVRAAAEMTRMTLRRNG